MVSNTFKKILLNKTKDQIEKLNKQDLYSVFSSRYFQEEFKAARTNRELYDLYKSAKKCDDMRPDVLRGVGQKLEELMNDQNSVVAVYENTSDGLKSDVIRSVLTYGIPLHHSQITTENLMGENKLYFADDILDLVSHLKRGGTGKFVLSFPSKLVNEYGDYRGCDFCELFNTDDENIYIKPKYVDSYIDAGQNCLNRRNSKSLAEILVQKIKPTE